MAIPGFFRSFEPPEPYLFEHICLLKWKIYTANFNLQCTSEQPFIIWKTM